MRTLVKTFKALSDSNRIRILKMLEIRPLCVCEITEILNLAASTVSKHLSILRDAGFIVDHKDGKWVNYYLDRNHSTEYVTDLLPLLSRWLPDDEKVRTDAGRVHTVDRSTICGI